MKQKCQRFGCKREFSSPNISSLCSTCQGKGYRAPNGKRKIKLTAVDLAMLKLSERD